MTPRYELFIMPACPYCQKVLRFMERRGIEMPLRDITSDPGAREELVRVGGKPQVPCLFIDGARCTSRTTSSPISPRRSKTSSSARLYTTFDRHPEAPLIRSCQREEAPWT